MLQLERLDEGTRTRILRVAAGLSQHDLASRAAVDRRRLSEHERGERPLPAPELARVWAALDGAIPQNAEGSLGAVG
jgi:transcriptional regulator with XRE-family HTH domain